MLPHLFQIGGFSLPTYGALVAVAFLVALWMTSRFAKQRGLNSEKVVNLGVYCALVGMLGAKLLMIAMDPLYRTHPAEIFTRETLQSAGIFYGGFIAALAFAFVYMHVQKMPVLSTADLFAPGVALGHGIGRLGCFSAGCCWGKPTAAWFGITFLNAYAHATVGVPLGVALYPTQLMESFAEVIIFLVLWRLARRRVVVGQLTAVYLISYGLVRFLVDFLRAYEPQAMLFHGLMTDAQLTSLGMIALAIGIWAMHARRRTAGGMAAA